LPQVQIRGGFFATLLGWVYVRYQQVKEIRKRDWSGQQPGAGSSSRGISLEEGGADGAERGIEGGGGGIEHDTGRPRVPEDW